MSEADNLRQQIRDIDVMLEHRYREESYYNSHWGETFTESTDTLGETKAKQLSNRRRELQQQLDAIVARETKERTERDIAKSTIDYNSWRREVDNDKRLTRLENAFQALLHGWMRGQDFDTSMRCAFNAFNDGSI